MLFAEFRVLHANEVAARPKAYALVPSDPAATPEMLKAAQAALGVKFPESYVAFLSEYGGGIFGFENVFSVEKSSEFFVVNCNKAARQYMPRDLLAFSDDFCGGHFVFSVTDGVAADQVRYWNADGGLSGPLYKNIFDFLARDYSGN